MAYADLDDVIPLVPSQVWTPSATSQPTAAQVEKWLDDEARWMDTALGWKYQTPITNDADQELLRPICAALVAAKVWGFLNSFNPQPSTQGKELRAEALQKLAYSATTGRASIALGTAGYTDTREADLAFSLSSFNDPDAEDGTPWLFRVGMPF